MVLTPPSVESDMNWVTSITDEDCEIWMKALKNTSELTFT